MAEINKLHPLYKEDIDYILSLEGLDTLKGKSVLITGATGMVGTMLIDALMQVEGVRVIAVGRNRQKQSHDWVNTLPMRDSAFWSMMCVSPLMKA